MMCTKNIAKSEFIFSQYSRKGYSIFSSLGIIIKIGTLGVELCNHGYLKCEQYINLLILQLKDLELTEEIDPNIIDLENEGLIINTPLILQKSSLNSLNLLRAIIIVPVIFLLEMTGFFMSNN